MSEVRYRSAADVALLRFDFKSCFIKRGENGFEFIELFRERLGPNQYIVDVDQTIFPIHVGKYALH